MKKHYIILPIFLIVLFLVTGCSKNNEQNNQNQEEQAQENQMPRWNENFEEASLDDLEIGGQISVMGTENSDGSISANQIMIGNNETDFENMSGPMRPPVNSDQGDQDDNSQPVQPPAVRTGDIVLYRTEAGVIAHRVIRIERRNPCSEAPLRAEEQISKPRHSPSQSTELSPHQLFFLRGDASENCDRPIEGEQILGKVVSVERDGRLIDPYSLNAKVMYLTRLGVSWLKSWIKEALFRRGASLM